MNILEEYLTTAPSPQNAIDIFKSQWSCKFPEPFASCAAGPVPACDDPRIHWALEELGGVEGARLLELGPLEAGHTYMLDRAGAESILSIEASTRAYLKCL